MNHLQCYNVKYKNVKLSFYSIDLPIHLLSVSTIKPLAQLEQLYSSVPPTQLVYEGQGSL